MRDENQYREQSRNVKIDAIKALAICFVIGIHVSAMGLLEYTIGSKKWLVIMLYRTIFAPAVPLFFMASGVLLFDNRRNVSRKKIFTKYIPKMCIALFFWAIVYEGMQVIHAYGKVGVFEKVTIDRAIENVVYFRHNYQLYYIYIMVLFYLFTPIIRVFLRHAQGSLIRYMLGSWFMLGIVLPTFIKFPSIMKFSNFTQYVTMHMGYASLGYGVLGYYIGKERHKKRYYLLSLLGGFCISFIMTCLMCISNNAIDTTFWGGMSVGVMLMATGIFGLIMNTDKKIYSFAFVRKISQASFAIFLCHDIFIKLCIFNEIKLSSLPSIINVPICMFLVFLFSYTLYLLLNKIKFIRGYLI